MALKRTLDDGFQKQVKELYLVDAVNFTEAETRTLDELRVYGDISVVGIKHSDVSELVDSHNPEDGFWYKAKLSCPLTSQGERRKRST